LAGVKAQVTLDVEDDLGELRRAREWLRDQLTWLPADTAEDFVLVADELVSNALRHGAAPRRLRLSRGGDVLRLEVEDGARTLATPREGTVTGGRGLTLVDVLATRWGQELTERGKVVWAELALG
jgi:two-component sensor histidine kinase